MRKRAETKRRSVAIDKKQHMQIRSPTACVFLLECARNRRLPSGGTKLPRLAVCDCGKCGKCSLMVGSCGIAGHVCGCGSLGETAAKSSTTGLQEQLHPPQSGRRAPVHESPHLPIAVSLPPCAEQAIQGFRNASPGPVLEGRPTVVTSSLKNIQTTEVPPSREP